MNFDMSELQGMMDAMAAKSAHMGDLNMAGRRAMGALNVLHDKQMEIDQQYRAEIDALERKYHALREPLYTKRAAIVAGEHVPTDEELGPKMVEALKKLENDPEVASDDKKGLPDFWMHVISNNDDICELLGMTDEDKDALTYLKDVRIVLLPRTEDFIEAPAMMEDDDEEDDENTVGVPEETEKIKIFRNGFSVVFEFRENPYFTNTILTKTYKVIEGEGEDDFEESVSDVINWKEGKNLTVKVTRKTTPAKKNGKKKKSAKVTMVTEPIDSFFNFFKSVNPAAMEEEDMEEEDLEEIPQRDYSIGMIFRHKLVESAINWYTGEAAMDDADFDFDGMDGEFDEDDYEDDDEDDDEEIDDESDDDEDVKAAPTTGLSSDPKENPECKQQ